MNRSKGWVMKVLFAVLLVGLIAAGCSSKQETEPVNQAGSQAADNKAQDSTDGQEQDNAGKEEEAATEEVEEVAEAPRTITHAMGVTEVTGTPQRVVVLTQEGTEALLELGVIPVGAVKSGLGQGWFPHIAAEMADVPELGGESQPNLELIVGLQPDLIIGNKVRHEQIYDQLSGIAPTVFSEDLSGQWKINFKLYAEALNLVEAGEAAMAAYDAHVEAAREQLGDKVEKQVSIVRFLPQAVRIYQKDTFAGVMLHDIGFARPASQDVDNFMEVITKEQMADMDGDIMFYFNADYDEEKGGTKNQQEWMNDPLYANLNVAKHEMAFQVDEVIWNLSGGIKAAKLLIDDLVKYADNLQD